METKKSQERERKNHIDIIKGALVNFSGIVAKSLNFIFFIVLGRLYGTETTGFYLLSWTAVDIISKISILGLDRALISVGARNIAAKDDQKLYNSIANSIKIGFIASILTFAFTQITAKVITNHLLERPFLETPLRIMSIALFFWTMSAIFIAASRSMRIMKYEVIIKSISEPLIMLLFSIILYKNNMGINALAISFVISTATGAMLSFYLFSRKFSVKTMFCLIFSKEEDLKKILKLSAPTGIYDMLNLLLQRIDLFVLTIYTSASTAGIYGIASEIAFSIKKVRQSFDPIFIPVISELMEKEDETEIKNHLKNVTRWIFTLDILLVSLFMILKNELTAIFGSDFTAGSTAMIILAVSVLINGTFGISELFILIEKPILNIFNTLLTIVINILLTLTLIPRYGMTGAAFSILISYIFMNTMRIIEVYIKFELQPFSKELFKTFVSAIIPLSLLLLVKNIKTTLTIDIILSVIFVFSFTLILHITKGLPEIKTIIKKLKKKRTT